jgi:hypothetical protein
MVAVILNNPVLTFRLLIARRLARVATIPVFR